MFTRRPGLQVPSMLNRCRWSKSARDHSPDGSYWFAGNQAMPPVLFLVSLGLGGSANFAPSIVAKLALSDAGWLLGLGILRYRLMAVGPAVLGHGAARRAIHS